MSSPAAPPFLTNLTRALKALFQFASAGSEEQTNVTAKLVRDMVKGLETQAKGTLNPERQRLLVATRDVFLAMKEVVSRVDEEGGANRQRQLLQAEQELKKCASVVYFLLYPDEQGVDHSSGPTHEHQALVIRTGQAAHSSPVSTSPLPSAREQTSEPELQSEESLLSEADELLRDLSSSSRPSIQISVTPPDEFPAPAAAGVPPLSPSRRVASQSYTGAASDRDWLQMPPIGAHEQVLDTWTLSLPIMAPLRSTTTCGAIALSHAPQQVLDPKGIHNDYPSHPLAQLERLLSTERGLDFLATSSLVLNSEQREELAAALALMFGHTQGDAAFIHWTILKELAANEEKLFKPGEFASLICKTYVRFHCVPFLSASLDGLVEDVCKNNIEIDLDPASADDIKKHSSRFGKLVDRLVDDICNNGKCPLQTKLLFSIIDAEVSRKYPQNHPRMLLTIFYGRFIGAALSDPELLSFRPIVAVCQPNELPTPYETLRKIALRSVITNREFARTTEKTKKTLALLAQFLSALAEPTAEHPPAIAECVSRHRDRLVKHLEDLILIPTDSALPRDLQLTDQLCLQAVHQTRALMIIALPKLRDKFASTLYPDNPLRSQIEQADAVVSIRYDEAAALTSQRVLDAHFNVITRNSSRSFSEPESEKVTTRVIRSLSNAEEIQTMQVEQKKRATIKAAAVVVPSPRKPSKRDLKPSAEEAVPGSARAQFLQMQLKDRKKWDQYYCVLKGRDLFIYSDRKAKEPKYTIRVDKFTDADRHPSITTYGFVLKNYDGEWYFGTDKPSDTEAWMALIAKNRQEYNYAKTM